MHKDRGVEEDRQPYSKRALCTDLSRGMLGQAAPSLELGNGNLEWQGCADTAGTNAKVYLCITELTHNQCMYSISWQAATQSSSQRQRRACQADKGVYPPIGHVY